MTSHITSRIKYLLPTDNILTTIRIKMESLPVKFNEKIKSHWQASISFIDDSVGPAYFVEPSCTSRTTRHVVTDYQTQTFSVSTPMHMTSRGKESAVVGKNTETTTPCCTDTWRKQKVKWTTKNWEILMPRYFAELVVRLAWCSSTHNNGQEHPNCYMFIKTKRCCNAC